jgi:glutamine amidotransferase
VEGGRPLLGICLGLQWLFEGSEEAPELAGLGVLHGRCTLLEGRAAGPRPLKVPHVGWNTLRVRRTSVLLEGVPDGTHVYFTHSYAAPVTDATVATTPYGEEFASVVADGSVFGVQFHPEKSSAAGLRMLRNFVAVCRAATVGA